MRKLRFVLLLTGFLALLMIIAQPLEAGSSIRVSGKSTYVPTVKEAREDGCTTVLTTEEAAVWDGSFVGDSKEEATIFIHCSGKWSFGAIGSFEEVTVDGKTGSMVLFFSGSRPNENTDWLGKWEIVEGTGELENLRGRGLFWGPGAPGPGEEGDIYYSGRIYFKPGKK